MRFTTVPHPPSAEADGTLSRSREREREGAHLLSWPLHIGKMVRGTRTLRGGVHTPERR